MDGEYIVEDEQLEKRLRVGGSSTRVAAATRAADARFAPFPIKGQPR